MIDVTQPDKQRGTVRHALLWTSFGQIVFFGAQFASSIVLARLLSPREMGIFGIGAATVGFVSALQALGLNNYVIRAETLDRALLATVFTVNALLSLMVTIGLVALGFWGSYLFKEPGTLQVMAWMATTPLIATLGLIPTSLIQRDNNFRLLSLTKIGGTLIGNALTIGLALAGFSYMSLAYGWVTTCAVNTIAVCIFAPQHVHFGIGLQRWREVSSFGANMFLVNGVTQAQRQVLNLLLGKFQGVETVGLYTRANSLFNLLSENTQTVAMRVLLVDFAEAARRGLELRSRYLRVVEIMSALMWPVFAGLGILAGPCIRLLYGPMWDLLDVPLGLLCVSGLLWTSIAMAWELFIVANEPGQQARIEMKRAAVGTVFFAIGCQFTLNIAVATRILEGIYSIFLYRPHIARITGCTGRDLTPVFLRSGLLTIVAVFPSTLVMFAYHWSPSTPLTVVLISIVVGILLWLLTLILMKHPLLAQLEEITRGRRRRAQLAAAQEDVVVAAPDPTL